MFPFGSVVTVPGKNQAFLCTIVSAIHDTHPRNISWLLNGSAVRNYGLDNVVITPGDRNVEILTFMNVNLRNNHTTVQCLGTLNTGVTSSSAPDAVLLLQGQ